MNPEQYERVGELFHAALELPRERRSAFLRGACGADESLRREVESLLVAHEQAGSFVAAPAGKCRRRLAGARGGRRHRISRRAIGAYEVVSLLGRGGMGEVYLARDPRLGRKVAVKLLQPGAHQQPRRRCGVSSRKRALPPRSIIRTSSRSTRSGTRGDRHFIAMEFVEGQSLTAMGGRPVDVDALARIGAQLARALAVTHAAGVVHRDIKPENVIVRARRLREGARLRSGAPGGEADGRRGARHRNQPGCDPRHAALHVARAGPRRVRDERQRRVLARRRALRAGHRHAPLRIGLDARHASRHHDERRAESGATRAADAAAAGAPVDGDA